MITSPSCLFRKFRLVALPAASAGALCLASAVAHAQSTPPVGGARQPEDPPGPRNDLFFTASPYEFGGDGAPRGVGLVVSAVRQKGWLGYGASVDYSATIFGGGEMLGASPLVGFFVDGPSLLRLGLVAAGGIHGYSNVGRGFFTNDSGASGVAPFLGARAFLGVEFGGKARVHFGLQGFLEDDLTRQKPIFSYAESVSLGQREESAARARVIGEARWGFAFALGGKFDL